MLFYYLFVAKLYKFTEKNKAQKGKKKKSTYYSLNVT